MDNKKKISTTVAIILLLVFLVGATFAFFINDGLGPTSRDIVVTSDTTDLLTFSVSQDISMVVSPYDWALNGDNPNGEATATAVLTPNSKTGTASDNYYLYLNLRSNPTVYSEENTNEDPELMLQVFNSSNQLVTLTELGEQITIKGVTGYDITGVTGLQTLLADHEITASNNQATTETWRIVITIINLDVKQNDNTGKTIEAEIIMRKDLLILGYSGTIYRNNIGYTLNNYSIENEQVSLWCYVDDQTGEPNCSYPFETEELCESWGDTCSEESVLIGPGIYQDSINNGKVNGSVLCIVDELNDYNSCHAEVNDRYYSGLDRCSSDIEEESETCVEYNYIYCLVGTVGGNDYNSCDFDRIIVDESFCENIITEGVNNGDIEEGDIECVQTSIQRSAYLKHEVENDIIQSTETCINYNNHEFCLEPGYWVETGNGDEYHASAENGLATMNKLQLAMETALGIEADYCNSSSNSTECQFNDHSLGCFASTDAAGCYDHETSCYVDEFTGIATCMH